jgi:hypothetical protein
MQFRQQRGGYNTSALEIFKTTKDWAVGWDFPQICYLLWGCSHVGRPREVKSQAQPTSSGHP